MVFDYASAWAWEAQPQGRDFDYFRPCFAFYRGLRDLGLNIDILPPDTADLSPYRLVLAPGPFSLGAPLMAALAACRGTAILGPRSNSRTPDFAIPLPLPPALPGLDCTVARVESLPPDVEVALEQGGALRHWREELEGGAQVVERSTDGWPVLMRGGKLAYLGGWPDATALARILGAACQAEGIATTRLPPGLRQRDTATHRFLVNYNPEPVSHQGVTIPAAGVVWSRL